MPIIKVELSLDRTHEQKALYVQKVTRLTAEVLDCHVASVGVMLVKIDDINWAHVGKFYGSPQKGRDRSQPKPR
jgi:4-oxalocrotonate tautomerase family enzyme